MELIPILSLIMLVATIATFILAIGAYILYKIRERNGRNTADLQPESVPAELVTPSYISSEKNEALTGDLGFTHSRYAKPLYGDIQSKRPRMRPTIVGPIYKESESQRSKQKNTDYRMERSTGQKKYLRYTQDGYIEPIKDHNKENKLKWR